MKIVLRGPYDPAPAIELQSNNIEGMIDVMSDLMLSEADLLREEGDRRAQLRKLLSTIPNGVCISLQFRAFRVG